MVDSIFRESPYILLSGRWSLMGNPTLNALNRQTTPGWDGRTLSVWKEGDGCLRGIAHLRAHLRRRRGAPRPPPRGLSQSASHGRPQKTAFGRCHRNVIRFATGPSNSHHCEKTRRRCLLTSAGTSLGARSWSSTRAGDLVCRVAPTSFHKSAAARA